MAKEYVAHNKIGGTLACVIANGNHFGKTPYSEWRIIVGKESPEDLSRVFRVQLGIETESLNAVFFSMRSGMSVDRSSEARGLHHAEDEDYLVCQPDGFVDGPNTYRSLFEAKHTSHMGNMDTQIDRYFPQLQHNMYVTDTRSAFLSVIFGNQDPEYCEIFRDDDWLARYLPAAKDFWRCVLTKTPPQEGMPIEKGKIRIAGRLEINSDHPSHNEFHAASVDYVETKENAQRHEQAKKQLKSLAPEEMQVTIGSLVEVRRDRRGYSRIRERSVD
jgi:predicted phage-related endonuclease